MDKQILIDALNQAGNHNGRTAQLLGVSIRSVERAKKTHGLTMYKKPVLRTHLQNDNRVDLLDQKVKLTQSKYEMLLKENQRLSELLEATKLIENINTHEITVKQKGNSNSLTAVALASDWHIEETVIPESVNYKNEFNVDIGCKRVDQFFISLVRLVNIFNKDIRIKTLILALLGDFINGQLREEAMENNSMRPVDAVLLMADHLTTGINYLIDNTDLDLIIPCHSGNHARTTKKIHIATESGNSLEFLLYHRVAAEFKGNQRVKFLIPTSYHSYVDVDGFIIRFHHGHAIKYNGGVGGIYIGVNKAIAQWNKVKHADLDCFGHFHQLRDGGNFVCNGSLIGWNSFSNFIKADYEKPKQTFFLISHERKEKITTCQVFLDEQ